MKIALAYITFAIWASCSHFEGELPDGRWEWAIGTHERITEVIPLEDQIKGRKITEKSP